MREQIQGSLTEKPHFAYNAQARHGSQEVSGLLLALLTQSVLPVPCNTFHADKNL